MPESNSGATLADAVSQSLERIIARRKTWILRQRNQSRHRHDERDQILQQRAPDIRRLRVELAPGAQRPLDDRLVADPISRPKD